MNYYEFFGVDPNFDLDILQSSFLDRFLIIEESYQEECLFLDQLKTLNIIIDMYLTLRIESRRLDYNEEEGITSEMIDCRLYPLIYNQYIARFGGKPLRAYEQEIKEMLERYQQASHKSSFVNDFQVRKELLKLIGGLQSIQLIDEMFKSMLKSSYNIDASCPDESDARLRMGGI